MLGFVIGDNNMITGFRLVGIEGVEATSLDEAKQALIKVLKRSDVAIVIVSQAFSSQYPIRDEIDRVRRERGTPLIVEMPGSIGPSMETRISDLVSQTLGVRV